MNETSPDQPESPPDHATPTEAADHGVAAEILRHAEACPPGKSFSPEDVARALSQSLEFQRLLTAVRRAAQRLARDGKIEILRKGKPINPDELRGVIRLRARRDTAETDTQ